MARPLRIEFPGAIYHVTSRGDRREPIYRDDADRLRQLDVMAQAMDRFDAQVLAYCQMGNHYHLALHTRSANLSRLMRHVNGVYTRDFNRRHDLVGHLFQGRFKAVLVDRDAYLLAVCRYVERNPVAARLVPAAEDWLWSSYRAHAGLALTPDWLDTLGLHGFLLGREVLSASDGRRAAALYAEFVAKADAQDGNFWQSNLRGQVFLGDEVFAERMRALGTPDRMVARNIPKPQRLGPRSWEDCLQACNGDRDQALFMAYRSCGLAMTALAGHAGLSVSHVSWRIAAVENDETGEKWET